MLSMNFLCRKRKQDEYKNSLIDMRSKDAKPLPDLATDS